MIIYSIYVLVDVLKRLSLLATSLRGDVQEVRIDMFCNVDTFFLESSPNQNIRFEQTID